jgi:glycosyltransferase involved in cell wall biosynthesis
MGTMLVDIVLSFHKSNDYVFQCLDSVIWQTYQNFNVHIIDDNSQSNILEKIKNTHKDDKRFKFYQNPSKIGFYQSVNRYFKHFEGELFFIFDSDDISFPDRLEKTIEIYEKEKFDLFSAPITNFSEAQEDNEKFQTAKEILNEITSQQDIIPYTDPPLHPYLDESDNLITSFINPTCCIKNLFFREINGYSKFFAGGDRDFAHKAFYYGAKFSSIQDKPLALYRIHHDQITACKNYGMNSYNRALIHKEIKQYEYSIYRTKDKNLIKKVGLLSI